MNLNFTNVPPDASTPTQTAAMDATTKQEADNMAKDVLGLVNKHFGGQSHGAQVGFIIDMCIYMVERDQKILRHGMEVGRG